MNSLINTSIDSNAKPRKTERIDADVYSPNLLSRGKKQSLQSSSGDNCLPSASPFLPVQNLHQDYATFWKLWQQYRGYLYHCGLKWMNGNNADAEEAVSRATFQAWGKWLDYSETISNYKAWLTQLTHNICMDMHRERNWCGQKVDSLESMQFADYELVPSKAESLESTLLEYEMVTYLRQTIQALSPKLQNPLILHYYHKKTAREIANQLNVSEKNVWKRLERGRTILKEELDKYLSGMGDSVSESLQLLDSIPPTSQSRDVPTLLMSRTVKSSIEPINYQVTATCLQTLPHAWYQSPTPLGWS